MLAMAAPNKGPDAARNPYARFVLSDAGQGQIDGQLQAGLKAGFGTGDAAQTAP